MASCASPLQPSPSSSSSSSSPFRHSLLHAAAAAAPAAPSHSIFARSALSDLMLSAECTHRLSDPPSPSLSPSPSSSSSSSASRFQSSAQCLSPLKKTWVSNLFRGSWRSEHFKENIENRREEPKPHEKVREQARATDARLSSSILKRKRPTKLDIPQLARLASFGKAKQFELSAHEASSPQMVSNENEIYGVCAKKGRKESMEDAYLAVTDFQGKPGQAFFGVFDGHGGQSAATFAAQNLERHISMAMEKQMGGIENIKDAMKDGYMALDLEFLAKNVSSGACSLSVLLKDGHLVMANAGDCKVVLSQGGKAKALNTLHRASNAIERQRIQDLGGYVDCFNGVWRLQSTLAVTRGFGDANLKEWVSAEPEVRQLMVSEECEFMILATDGLWDKVSDQEAVDCAREMLSNCHQEPPIKVQKKHCDSMLSPNRGKGPVSFSSSKADACKKLMQKACDQGNLDDITIIIVPLQGFAATSS